MVTPTTAELTGSCPDDMAPTVGQRIAELEAQNARFEAEVINPTQTVDYWRRKYEESEQASQREVEAALQGGPRELPDAMTSEDFEPDMPTCTEVE